MAINPVLVEPKLSFWQLRATQHGFLGLSTSELNRAALRFFGMLAAAGAVTAVTMGILGSLPWTVSLLALPAVALSVGSIWYSIQLNDYDNPKELEKYRNDAMRMSLDQVAHAHGWNNVLRWGILPSDLFATKYRQQVQRKSLMQVIEYYEKVTQLISQTPQLNYNYEVPTPREWRGQWRTETAAKTFEEVITLYSLEKLEKYSILEVGELRHLKELKTNYDSFRTQRDRQAAQIEREFQNNTQGDLGRYNLACSQADAEYNNHFAVRELQGIEMRYVRERQDVQDALTRRKMEARARFDRAVITITQNGQVPYDRMQPSEKAIYDQQRMELNLAETQADNEARHQISMIDSRYVSERTRLNSEESRARAARVQKLNEAQTNYTVATTTQRRVKEEKLAPIETSFRSSVADLNRRYNAFLRTIGAV